jgi:hypothetical protein
MLSAHSILDVIYSFQPKKGLNETAQPATRTSHQRKKTHRISWFSSPREMSVWPESSPRSSGLSIILLPEKKGMFEIKESGGLSLCSSWRETLRRSESNERRLEDRALLAWRPIGRMLEINWKEWDTARRRLVVQLARQSSKERVDEGTNSSKGNERNQDSEVVKDCPGKSMDINTKLGTREDT